MMLSMAHKMTYNSEGTEVRLSVAAVWRLKFPCIKEFYLA